MKRNRLIFGRIFPIAVLMASAVAVFSQPPSGDAVFQRQPFSQEPGSPPRTPPPRDDTFNFISGEMSFDGKLVKDAPYSAQVVTETTQTLSDGNRIVNRATASIYRDSEGRTRREQTLRTIGGFATAGDAPQMIFINDPVAQMSYVLDARTHIARKMPFFRFDVRVPPPAEAKTPKPSEAQTPPADRGESNGNVYVVTSPPAEGGYRVEYFGGGKRAKSESLGKQLVEGIQAEGTRMTVTLAAGEIGNELPIAIVNERWYSPELQTVVMSRQIDPRFGETVYRLTNIDRSEPDKSLFEVPADYTVSGVPGTTENAGGNVGVSTNVPAPISGGVLNGKATSLPAPEYPAIARQAHASGAVTVQVTIDEGGNVIFAKAVAGHPLLQAAAVSAARQAKFSPTRLSGQPVKVSGVLIYNFGAQ